MSQRSVCQSFACDYHVTGYNFRTLSAYFEGLMQKDNRRNVRFSIKFSTSIGLGGLT